MKGDVRPGRVLGVMAEDPAGSRLLNFSQIMVTYPSNECTERTKKAFASTSETSWDNCRVLNQVYYIILFGATADGLQRGHEGRRFLIFSAPSGQATDGIGILTSNFYRSHADSYRRGYIKSLSFFSFPGSTTAESLTEHNG